MSVSFDEFLRGIRDWVVIKAKSEVHLIVIRKIIKSTEHGDLDISNYKKNKIISGTLCTHKNPSDAPVRVLLSYA